MDFTQGTSLLVTYVRFNTCSFISDCTKSHRIIVLITAVHRSEIPIYCQTYVMDLTSPFVYWACIIFIVGICWTFIMLVICKYVLLFAIYFSKPVKYSWEFFCSMCVCIFLLQGLTWSVILVASRIEIMSGINYSPHRITIFVGMCFNLDGN